LELESLRASTAWRSSIRGLDPSLADCLAESDLPGQGAGIRDPGARWIAIDPTNRGRAGETHVKIGHGRHCQDVAPIRGVYRGPATGELTTSVEMRQLNEEGGG
jgi:hypothetical protein